MGKKKISFKKVLNSLIVIIAVGAIIYSSYNIIDMYLEDRRSSQINDELIETVNHNKNDLIVLSKKDYQSLKEKNKDFVGWISFESGMINEPVVQAADNDYYLRRDFYGAPMELGTVFMDAYQTLESQNLTLYGHYVYRDDDSMFTPLNKLVDQANYKDNQYFTFTDSEYRRDYQVAKIFYHSTSRDTHINYMLGDYANEQEFFHYIDTISQRELYNTGVEFRSDDKMMTLQTCVRDDADARLIVIGKEINRVPID